MPNLADIPEMDKAYLLGYLRNAVPGVYAEALAALEESNERIRARAAVTA